MEISHRPLHESIQGSRQLSSLGKTSLLGSGSQFIRGNIEMNLDGEAIVQNVHTLSKEELSSLEDEAVENGKEVLKVDSTTDPEQLAAYCELINSGDAICLIPSVSSGSKLLNALSAAQKAMEAGVQPHRLLFEDDKEGQSDIAANLKSILS